MEYSIRSLSDRERLAIEDFFFRTSDIKVSLNRETTAIIVPQNQTGNVTMPELAVLVEFALGILAVSGFQAITLVATLNSSTCSAALKRSYQETTEIPTFPKRLVKTAASTWVRHFFSARLKTKDKM